MKKQILTILSTLFATCLFAQGILNADFENWSVGEPNDWGTPNQATSILGVTTVTETNDAFSGGSAIRIDAAEIIIPLVGTFPVPGFAAAGAVNIDIINQGIDLAGGHPYKFRPTNFGGVYKSNIAGPDTAQIQVFLTKSTGGGGAPDFVGEASLEIITSDSVYTPFNLPIIYNNNDRPDSILIVLSTSKIDMANPGIPGATVGSWLQVDSLWLIEPFEAYFGWASVCVGQATSFEDCSSGDPTSWSWTFGDGNTSTDENPTNTYATSGNFSVQLVTSNGTDSDTMTQSITIYDLPTISVTPTVDTICSGSSTTVTASGGATYSWSPAASVSDPNSSSPSVNPTSSTTYTVTGTTVQGCSATAQMTVYVKTCAGVNELASLNELLLFPNPASEFIKLELNMNSKDDLQLQVLDNSGRQLFSKTMDGVQGRIVEEINLSNWPQGIYHIQLTSEQGTATHNFLIQ